MDTHEFFGRTVKVTMIAREEGKIFETVRYGYPIYFYKFGDDIMFLFYWENGEGEKSLVGQPVPVAMADVIEIESLHPREAKVTVKGGPSIMAIFEGIPEEIQSKIKRD